MATTKPSAGSSMQDTGRAKRAAKRGPVFIADRVRPSHALLTVEEYQNLTGGQKSIVQLLGMPQAAKLNLSRSHERQSPSAGRFVLMSKLIL